MFIEYQLKGIVSPAAWPLAGVTFTKSGTPPVLAPVYTVTSMMGLTIPDDLNGAISIQVITLGGTANTLVLEVCNRDPTTQISNNGSFATGLDPSSLDVGLVAQFTDTSTAGLWVAVQTTNVNTNIAGATITAAGLYVAQALAYRNIRVRQTVGDTTSTAQVVLGYGILV